jgi:hypothetical protein
MDEWQTLAAKLVRNPAKLVATIANAFPLSLGKHFGFDTTLFQIAVPEQLTADLITLAEQQQIVAARQQAARQAGEKIRGDVAGFVAECVASLREQTATLCEEMLQSISDGKTDGVHQKTLNRLTRFIDQFKQMNFANDAQMEAQLNTRRIRRFSSAGSSTVACSPQLSTQRSISSRLPSSMPSSSSPSAKGRIFCDGCHCRSETNRAANASKWIQLRPGQIEAEKIPLILDAPEVVALHPAGLMPGAAELFVFEGQLVGVEHRPAHSATYGGFGVPANQSRRPNGDSPCGGARRRLSTRV